MCEARYQSDGKWYEARIQTMTADKSTFVVLYTGYNETEKVSVKDVRPAPATAATSSSSSGSRDHKKRPAESASNIPSSSSSSSSSHTQPQGIKKKQKSSDSGVQKKEVEHQAKQSNWLNFSAKAAKTGKIPSKSIFSSPDSIDGKVGVTGSGRRMTGNNNTFYRNKYLGF